MVWPQQALLLGFRIINQGPCGDGQGDRKTSVCQQEEGGACSHCADGRFLTSGSVKVGIKGEGEY